MFDILVYGLSVAVCGMLTVFAALIILIGLVKVLEKFVAGSALSLVKGKAGAKEAARFRNESEAPAAAQEAVKDNGELIAVITAAVAAMLEAEAASSGAAVGEAPKGFVVRSIRRVSNAPAWNRAGREEQVYSRM